MISNNLGAYCLCFALYINGALLYVWALPLAVFEVSVHTTLLLAAIAHSRSLLRMLASGEHNAVYPSYC